VRRRTHGEVLVAVVVVFVLTLVGQRLMLR